jgi:hypothetical protein
MQALSIYVHRKTSFISTDKIILKEEGPDIKTAFDNMFIYICKTKNIYINWLSNLHSPFNCSLIEVVTMPPRFRLVHPSVTKMCTLSAYILNRNFSKLCILAYHHNIMKIHILLPCYGILIGPF